MFRGDINSYFYAGFRCTEILEHLNVCHRHQISLSTLKENLKLRFEALIAWRATVEEVNNAVQKELDATDADLGYRRIWESLKKQKILVRKGDV